MPALVTALCLLAFFLAYRTYARFLARRVFQAQDRAKPPALTKEDGRDYVPTSRHILFGHHFTSIAGAAPIIGPCVAAYWGWLPAVLWVVFGTIFIGAVHDFGSLMASAREGGRSIGDLAASVLNPRARVLFLCFVVVLVWLVLAVFAMAIAGLFVSQPSAVLPINIEIVVAVLMGWLLYRRRVGALAPSIVALLVLYGFVYLGTRYPVDFVGLGLHPTSAERTWILLLFGYSAVASLLPVWLLLQPRDFINSHQLFVGLALLFAGLFVAQPHFDAPAWRVAGPGAPPIFPLLFVTIACGAVSGFHGLVASGTSSKQLASFQDGRLVGYGSMLGEGALALAATMAAVAGIGLVGECSLPSQGPVADLSWSVYYDTWSHAATNKAAAFVLGGAAFLTRLGLPDALARTLMAVLVISFAATTLDTATRIQRLVLSELGKAVRIAPLENRYFATALAVVPAAGLALWEIPDPSSGELREAGWVLWPIFGASNQLLAALTLLVLVLYFGFRKRPVLPLAIPMVLVTSVAIAALFFKVREFWAASNLPLFTIGSLLLLLALWMLGEGALAISRARRQPAGS